MKTRLCEPSLETTVAPPASPGERAHVALGRARYLALPCAVALVSFFAVMFLASPPTASSQPHKDASPAKLAGHASKAYADTFARHKSGMADVEAVYTWSVRWLDAELRASSDSKAKKRAFTDHQARMRDLRNQVKSQVGIGTAPAVAEYAADYFATEAALWRAALSRD